MCSSGNRESPGSYGFTVNVAGRSSTARIEASYTSYTFLEHIRGAPIPPVSASYGGVSSLWNNLVGDPRFAGDRKAVLDRRGGLVGHKAAALFSASSGVVVTVRDVHPVSKLFLVLACAALALSLAVHASTCLGLFWAYTLFNFFFAAIILNEGASPGVVVGERVLFTHGAVVRTLAEVEYARHLVYEARAIRPPDGPLRHLRRVAPLADAKPHELDSASKPGGS